jgi:hypothetical protein
VRLALAALEVSVLYLFLVVDALVPFALLFEEDFPLFRRQFLMYHERKVLYLSLVGIDVL